MCVVLQSQNRESLALGTKGSRVKTISIAVKNEIDGGRNKDVKSTTFDPSLRS